MTKTRIPVPAELQRMLDSIPTPVAWISNDLTYLFANPAYARRFGLQPDEIVGREMRSVLGGETFDAIEPFIEAALRGETVAFDRGFGNAGDAPTYLQAEYRPNIAVSGEVDGFFVQVQDITEARQQALELQSSETKFALLFEKMLDGCALHEIICGEDGKPVDYRFVEINPAFEVATGLRRDDVVGKTAKEVLPELEREWIDIYGEVAFGGESARFESLSRALGRVFDVSAFSTGAGTFAATFRDITEDDRVELQRIVENSPAVSFLWRNEDGWPVEFVSENVSLYGYTPDDFLTGRVKFADIVHPEDIGRIAEEVAAYSAGDTEEFSQEYRLKTAGGAYIWIDDHTWFRRAADGSITHFQGILIDVTEKKEVAWKLHQAIEEAEAANRAKSAFLAAMSHDLRTPLNAIIGFSDLMRTHAFGPIGEAHYEEYAEDIHRSGRLLISLINDILDLSKIEAHKYLVNDQMIDLAALIGESVDQNRAAVMRPDQTVTIAIAPGLPALRADERALIQIMNNLVSNAIKFSADDGRILIRAWQEADRAIAISVADNGIGMSENDLALILQPFAQAADARARRHEGTGLGLYLVQNLMNLHGGNLDIESELGKGTTVTVRFPPGRSSGS